jgi:hypothetical protein
LGWRLSLADPPFLIVTTPSRIKPALVLVAFLAAAFVNLGFCIDLGKQKRMCGFSVA